MLTSIAGSCLLVADCAPMSAPTRIQVYVQPRAARTEVAGHHGASIKIRVAAPPVADAANAALVAFVARKLDLPPRAVRLVSGRGSRHKLLEIDGLAAEAVAARLA